MAARLAAAASFFAAKRAGGGKERAAVSVTPWEYQTLRIKVAGMTGVKLRSDELNADLAAYGADGWELVSVAPIMGGAGVTSELVAFFKRPLR